MGSDDALIWAFTHILCKLDVLSRYEAYILDDVLDECFKEIR